MKTRLTTGPWLLFLLVVVAQYQGARALYFEHGYDHHYTYSSETDMLGMHNITTIIKLRIRGVNSTASGHERLHQLIMDSMVQYSAHGYVADNPMNWNLSHKFYFIIGLDGVVTFVHFHPDDEYEVLSLKKVLTATISTNIKGHLGKGWTFKSKESDNSGEDLEYEYEGEKTAEGSTIVRRHRSTDKVHRQHYKTLLLTPDGTPHHMTCWDNVTLQSPTPAKPRKLAEGEAEIPDSSSGDFPKISAISSSSMKLTLKGSHGDSALHDIADMERDTVVVREKVPDIVPLDRVQNKVEELLVCVQSYEHKFERNRTACVSELRQVLSTLHKEDFVKLGRQFLLQNCEPNTTMCADERMLFLDLLATDGSATTQMFIADFIFSNETASQDDVQRCLLHCVTLKEPIPSLIREVERMCFNGSDNMPANLTAGLSKTQRRACLAQGSLAKALHVTNVTESDRLVQKLEEWLSYHNQSEAMDIIKPRMKRSIFDQDADAKKHIHTKMVLLHSLGNAGKQRSVGQIMSYMKPNVGVSPWRRAAVNSLRHFKCNQSVTALITSAVHDDDGLVRKVARDVLKQHPLKPTPSTEQENIILSKRYTYPVVSRIKRDLLDTLEKGIELHMEPPGIDWDKALGNSHIGANFGLHMRNILDLKLGLLSGNFLVDIYDGAYATAHVGMIDMKVDIVKMMVCYKGHAKYNLNILKDFGINSLRDLVNIFDNIADSIVSPITEVIESFKNVLDSFGGQGLKLIIKTLKDIVLNLPYILGDVAKRIMEFIKDIIDIKGSSELEDIKIILMDIRNTMDVVRRDILLFYNDMVDIVAVQLPYVGKKILQGFNVIKNAIMTILQKPLQSIFEMIRGVSQIKMALTLAVDVKNRITLMCQFNNGRSKEWMTAVKKIPNFFRRLTEAFGKLGKSLQTQLIQTENEFSNGVQPTDKAVRNLEDDLKEKWEKVLAPLLPLLDIPKLFTDAYKSVTNIIKAIKSSFKKVKTVIEMTKSKVQKVFGPKFHMKFPNQRRERDSRCPTGIWPTTTGDTYATTGVDILLRDGSPVFSPVDCIVHVQSDTKVVLQPTGDEFAQLEIVIENIDTPSSNHGERFSAGSEIGKASAAPTCDDNYIHVSVRVTAETEITHDADYQYVDPSPYLDRFMPIPKWIQECNDYDFRYITAIADVAELVKDAIKEAKKRIKRLVGNAIDFVKLKIEGSLGDLDLDFEQSSYFDSPSFEEKMDLDFTESIRTFGSRFNKALFGNNGLFQMLNIFDIVDLNRKHVGWILSRLDEATPMYHSFTNTIEYLYDARTAVPIGNPIAMPIPYVRGILADSGSTKDVGDVTDMTAALMIAAETKCPVLKDKISTGGHVCTAHSGCMGVTCSVALPIDGKVAYAKLGVVVNPSGFLAVSIGSNAFELDAHESEHSIDTGIPLGIGRLSLKLVVGTTLTSDTLSLSVEVKLCHDLLRACINPVEVITDVIFPLIAQESTTPKAKYGIAEFQQFTLQQLINELGEYDLLNREVTDAINQVRVFVLNQLLAVEDKKVEDLIDEFTDMLDFCEDAYIPFGPLDFPIFEVSQTFPVGPILFRLGFGAGVAAGFNIGVDFCILGLSANVTLTPWVTGYVWGALSVDIGFALGGIRLTGYLLETKFPLRSELSFAKFPIDIGAKMDLVLTPLRLVLSAFAQLRLLWKKITVFEANIWEYKVQSTVKNIFNKLKHVKDNSPPKLTDNSVSARRKRSGDNRGCIVQQLAGRLPDDPAFSLEVHAEDTVSDVKLFYTIGTYRGGTNIVDWTDMGGATLLVPANLPSGIPLYWTVKAENSQGLTTTTECFLNTFDSTIPDGRVEHPYKFSSHPGKISASVVVFEDSLLEKTHYVSLGYCPGKFGSEFVSWQPIELGHSQDRDGASGLLSRFTVPREGKLIAYILKSIIVRTPELCAQTCIDYGLRCVSFDYEKHSETCDLHDVVQGPSAVLANRGTYSNYERLGIGYNTLVEYIDLPLTHGTLYFINARVRNVLGYTAYLVGEGTMIDFTPPEPGVIRNNVSDVMRADGCKAAITQRCNEVTWKENHRIIIDGPESETIVNGLDPRHDSLYTLANHYLSANWNGFHDDESGIWGYTWAVGTHVCGADVLSYTDPYVHLTNKKFWTDSGFHKRVHLADGPYYVTVQALNGADLGGSLVTTVCHSVPIIVDTSAPLFLGVTNIIYDEDFDLIAIYYKAIDDLSKIGLAEFGLGKTKYDVQLKAYSQHDSMERDDPFLSLEELGLREGIPAWIRVRVTNNVGLFTTGHGDEPILIDRSRPVAGEVMDGSVFQRDLAYQSDDKNICAQWRHFYDPESGIDRYTWSVGTTPGNDDVVRAQNKQHYEKTGCAAANLQHNHTYYSTVYAYNNALNSKGNHSLSDGVLIDITPPLGGLVKDGTAGKPDIKFTSETVTKSCNWDGFRDPESGIDRYQVAVYVNTERKGTFDVSKDTTFDDHTVSLEHCDEVYLAVYGINGAELETAARSDGFVVDHTAPVMVFIHDHDAESPYQSDSSLMNLRWKYHDTESGIKEYRTIIYQRQNGVKRTFWPTTSGYNITLPGSAYSANMSTLLDDLELIDGVTYSLHVTAINQALLSVSHESPGVTIDTTPPTSLCVHIGLLSDEEEEDVGGNIIHNDQNGIRVSWGARDSESGIKRFLVAVGVYHSKNYLTDFVNYGEKTTSYIQNVYFELSAELNKRYIVYVKAINGAGLVSEIGQSKPIYIVKANVPGVVFDGRQLFEDETFSNDHNSIAASFYGFSSEACNIIGYDWGIGTTEYGTDLLSFTDYGVVMQNATHGFAQINSDLIQDMTYYVTIRAVTGCHSEYIVSSSDGITIDSEPPDIYYTIIKDIDVAVSGDVVYQATGDILSIMSNVSDTQHIAQLKVALGTLPFEQDIHELISTKLANSIQLAPGKSVFMTTYAIDAAGNDNISCSRAVIADMTMPVIHNFSCTPHVSLRKSIVSCHWTMLEERESTMSNLTFAAGTRPIYGDIISQYIVPHGSRQFNIDVIASLKRLPNITSLYIDVSTINVIGHRNDYEEKINVDRTPPTTTSVTVVTRLTNIRPEVHQQCQSASTYMELFLNGAEDDESGVDYERFEVCVGSKQFGSDLLPFKAVNIRPDGSFFVNDFELASGSVFYATIRAYNKAGLSIDTTSDRVVVSHSPYLHVFDGPGAEDIDFQSHPNVIEGYWEYSDICPIKSVRWQIRDILDNVIVDFTEIPDAATHFYNDGLKLENGVKYISVIKTVDAIDRIRVARSDGLTVRIQPPSPGFVRDGLEEDINYQSATTELSANWDDFGDTSNDLTQRIHHYLVALGDDIRYASTRTNVHYFVDVGSNTSYTFMHLNLTSRLVKYYVTVRAVSMSSGFSEGYSNGIRVGFDDKLVHGKIMANKYQSLTDTISLSWNGFYSDIGIRHYIAAISSHRNFITNDTVDCKVIGINESVFDVSPMLNTGLDEYVKLSHLNLLQNMSYYPTVIAADDAGMCTVVTGTAIRVDITPPLTGNMFINGISGSNISFAKSNSQLAANWNGVSDAESGIEEVLVNLFQCPYCTNMSELSSKCESMAEAVVKHDTTVTFYELELSTVQSYIIRIVVRNRALLNTVQYSPIILVDTSHPSVGTVKITDDWKVSNEFQSSTTSIQGLLAVATTFAAYTCDKNRKYFPSFVNSQWEPMNHGFTSEFLTMNQSGAFLGIGYNSDMSNIIRSGITSGNLLLDTGEYSFNIRAATGDNITTTFALITDANAIPFTLTDKPVETVFDWKKFDNASELRDSGSAAYKNDTHTSNAGKPPRTVHSLNITTNGQINTTLHESDFGIGVHILGYKIKENTAWHHMFWARSKSVIIQQWFRMENDPTASNNVYTIIVNQANYGIDSYLDLTLLVNGNDVVTITGFAFPSYFKFAMLTWNEDNYQPPIYNIYQPFYAETIVSNIYVPQSQRGLCQYGRGFYDGESQIKEIWAGVSDSEVAIGNVSPLENIYSFCYVCKIHCDKFCQQKCDNDTLSNEYELLPLTITGLNLSTITVDSACLNVSSGIPCRTNYYLNVKIVNFAGQSTTVHSNSVQVDNTPPVCQYVECMDPEYSEDEPTSYLGSSSNIGAFWNCSEDVGQIQHYNVSITTGDNATIIMKSTNVGRKSKVSFSLGLGTFSDGNVYRIHTTAVNTAGMRSTTTCLVRVELQPPSVAGSLSTPIYATRTSDDQVAKTSSQGTIGIRWTGGGNDTELYEWQLGTGQGSHDVFPPVKVGMNSTGSAAIIDGKLHINGYSEYTPVSAFHSTTNMTGDEWVQRENAPVSEKTFFYMEPGRCVFQTLHAVGYSHLKRKLKTMAVCVKRPDDVEIGRREEKNAVISRSKHSTTWQNGASEDAAITIDIASLDGELQAGTLALEDKVKDYGSAASPDFVPYISDPKITGKQTSRVLRNRIVKFCDISFYISPTPSAVFESANITISLPTGCKMDADMQLALIFWDPAMNEWTHNDEGCNSDLTSAENKYITQLCIPSSELIHKRPTVYTMSRPRQMEVVQIYKTLQNHAPIIKQNIIQTMEDDIINTVLETYDQESDKLFHRIVHQPKHANCTISELGFLNCILEVNYYGSDEIEIQVTEYDLPPHIEPLSSSKVIRIQVGEAPDPTKRLYVDPEGWVHREMRPRLTYTMIAEANTTSIIFAGTIILTDVDGEEEFTPIASMTGIEHATYTLTETAITNVFSVDKLPTIFNSVKTYKVHIHISPTTSGELNFRFIAQTKDMQYTPSVSIDLYLLMNPCVEGTCRHRSRPSGCDNISRTKSFAEFECVCRAGYIGQWCEVDVNECQLDPCAALYNCNDMVNTYSCTINVPKLMAVLVCSVLAAVGTVILTRWLLKRWMIKTYYVNKLSNNSDTTASHCESQIALDNIAYDTETVDSMFHPPAVETDVDAQDSDDEPPPPVLVCLASAAPPRQAPLAGSVSILPEKESEPSCLGKPGHL